MTVPHCKFCPKLILPSYALAWNYGVSDWWCGMCTTGREMLPEMLPASALINKWDELRYKRVAPYILKDIELMVTSAFPRILENY